MWKFKRNRRAQNTIAESLRSVLVTTGPPIESAPGIHLSSDTRVVRHTLFTAELEEVIEIIARERVYRAMLARLAPRLLAAPAPRGDASGA